MLLDDVAVVLAQADRHASAGEWAKAEAAYDEALRLLPPEKVAIQRRVRLERAKVQMMAAKLPFAHLELKTLVQEIGEDPAADPKLLAEARSSLANAQYYMTWLMRLEGEPRAVWEPEIEAARQTYKLLAEQAEAKGDPEELRRYQEDLESAIRLSRMSLSDLQALALPSQCQGCCSGDCNGTGTGKKVAKGKGKGKGQGMTPLPGEGEPKDTRGASSGPPPDNSGH
jgi:hypothetical protein